MAHAHDPSHDEHAPLQEGDDLPAHGTVPSEPRSPVWLPFLGAALAGVALVWWLSTPSDAEEAAAAAASASASASAAAAAPPEGAPQPAEAPKPAPPKPAPPPPPPGGGGAHLPQGIKGLEIAPGVDVNPKFKKK